MWPAIGFAVGVVEIEGIDVVSGAVIENARAS